MGLRKQQQSISIVLLKQHFAEQKVQLLTRKGKQRKGGGGGREEMGISLKD